MGLLATLVLQVPAVNLKRGQQRHHLPEDLLVGLGQLAQPPLE